MKKLIYTSLIALFSFATFAQDAANKKVQAGLVFGTGVNFTKVNTRNFDVKGVTPNLSVGAMVNIGFTNNIGLSTGIEFDFDNAKYTSDSVYYDFNDTKIFRANEKSVENNASVYKMTERNQSAIYLTIPTMVVFRTNYIGYFRYYGKIGLRNSFLLTSKSNDIGTDPFGLPGNTVENKGMKLNKGNDMLFYRGSVGLAAGAEWNFIGSTCMALEIGYYYGFTPLFYNTKADKRIFYKATGFASREYVNNIANQSQLLIRLSFLF